MRKHEINTEFCSGNLTETATLGSTTRQGDNIKINFDGIGFGDVN
jgi:hypothetical protein